MDSKHSTSASASSAQLLAGPADQPRSHRQTDCLTRLPLPEFVETMAQTEAVAEQTLIKARWRDGVRCPHCNSADIRKEDAREEGCATAFRCGSCAKDLHRPNQPLHGISADGALSDLAAGPVPDGLRTTVSVGAANGALPRAWTRPSPI